MQHEKHGKAEMTEAGLVVPAIIVIVGQACSLKCKHCANFSPYSPHETKRYPLQQITDALRVIFQASHHVRKIQVQGGEPFLYSELADLLDFIRNNDPETAITVATNGTIVPDEAVLLALKRNHVIVRISDYAVTPPERVLQLKERLEEFGVEDWLYEFASQDSMWYDMGRQTIPCEGNVEERFFRCPFNDCFTLENGKISRCSRAVIAERVQGFVAREGDFLSVEPADDFSERLWNYLKTPRYMEACRYCLGAEGEKVAPAQQLDK